MNDLSKVELFVYFVCWTGCVVYSTFQCYLVSNRYSQYLSEDLVPGWKWVGRKVDTADFEWKMWTPIFFSWLQYVIPYLVISLVLKTRHSNLIPFLGMSISFLWLYNMLGLGLTLFLLIQPVLFNWIFQLFSLKLVWITSLASTFSLHALDLNELMNGSLFDEDSTQEYFFSVLIAWTHARSISFLVDTRSSNDQEKKLVNFYHYCFYLPLLPSGPLLLYRDFKASIDNPQIRPGRALAHVIDSGIVVVRFLFWWFFHQLALHYFYHSAIQYHPGIVQRLDVWSSAGLGYSLGQFFMIKYLVLYGLPFALAKMDYVDAPPPPKCVSRIHLYSQMWRDFDRGLYNFMFNYIYIPFKGNSDRVVSKLLGTGLCFGFVCIWHGGSSAVVIWCVSNYLGICLEMTARYFSTCRPFTSWKASWSNANWVRFQAAIASPLLLLSALSNFCFFTDANVGYLLARKGIYEGGFTRLFGILLAMYSCCHVSMAISRREKKPTILTQQETLHQE
uniref:EOG090X06SF n=1 Tax=Scapholeberis mucronata TaxID=202097 RepID=A0A4Y7NN40_9CRUS|nr:EOG090X06SF [Scapholeberis mucronata]